MQDSVKIGKRKFKNWRSYSSRFLEYAECGYFTLLLRPFVNKGKEMNNELLTHAYTAFVPVSVGVKVCLIKLLKRNKRLNNEQPNEHKKNPKDRPNKTTAENAENISALKRNQNIYNDVPATQHATIFCTNKNLHGSTLRSHETGGTKRIFERLSVQICVRATFWEERPGTMSKNNLRGIKLALRPTWDIHSPTLKISWQYTIIINCLPTGFK